MKRKAMEWLIEWKEENQRKPLILNGARQVGKTYLLREFGKEHFTSVLYVNLESNHEIARLFDDDITPARLLRYLEAATAQRILPRETLIILDEIQACERAVTSLKYFCEEAPEYHVVAAGSLLGVALHHGGGSFPVGKVTTYTLHPLDFEEYLWAVGEEFLWEEICAHGETLTPMHESLHQKALERYREYLIVGGMPEAVKRYVQSGSYIEASLAQSEILDNYVADMAKYATNSEAVKIRACYNSIPVQLAKDNKKFQYKVVQKGGSATIFGASLEWLKQAGVILECQRVEQGLQPLPAYADQTAFKIYMSDVGLLVNKSGMMPGAVLMGENNLYMGAITENYVAQQLAAKGDMLYYWAPENSQAELDFLVQRREEMFCIEVKAGEHVRSRSLGMFVKKYEPTRAIRLSTKNFGKAEEVLSVPLYATFLL